MGGQHQTATDRLELAGDYDLTRREELHRLLARFDGKRPVVINVAKVTYADSTFLNELASFRKARDGCPVTIEGPSTMMKRLLKILSFDKLFTIVEPK